MKIEEKTYMILRKKSAEQRKILLIFGGFYGKKQLKKALFLNFFWDLRIFGRWNLTFGDTPPRFGGADTLFRPTKRIP